MLEKIGKDLILSTISNYPRRNSTYQAIRRYIFCNNGIRSYNCSIADIYTGKNANSIAYPNIIANSYPPPQYIVPFVLVEVLSF